MDGGEDLEEDENDTGEPERTNQAVAALHSRDEDAHGNREDRGQDAAKQEDDPPRDCKAAVRLREDREELPLVALAKTLQHGLRRPQQARRPRIPWMISLLEPGTVSLVTGPRRNRLRRLTT